ncbi:UNVERIFIED_CONTAM: SWI/SNF complex component SNF12 [Sesamum angustifolium]|uniref:SWI/SNF complex component SNF12 n=1 Tax=Sesamum angustifolium TaxID=2727405 RepID=A0AAW2RJH6_9LAMI
MSTFLANLEKNKVIDACDEAISSSVKKIHEHCRRRAFFLGFSQSPAEFINALIASQARDLKLASADASREAEKAHRAESTQSTLKSCTETAEYSSCFVQFQHSIPAAFAISAAFKDLFALMILIMMHFTNC